MSNRSWRKRSPNSSAFSNGMNPIKKIYSKLSIETRTNIRSLFPRSFLRWYAHRKTDVYLISYPKCGRTWLRLMMGYAISRHFNLPAEQENLLLQGNRLDFVVEGKTQSIPHITVVHDDRPMLKAPEELERSKRWFRNKKVIFLSRDPRDVIVSSYFEMKKRGHIFGDNPYENREAVFDGSLSEFIDKKTGGFDTILEYFNIWAANQHVPRGFLLVRYEDIKADPTEELKRVVDFIDVKEVKEATLTEAVEFASFENMQRMEREGRFSSGILKPGDQNDKESFKTRKGQVGGYRHYLSEEEIIDLNRKLSEKLSHFFGYQS
jgi:hypothetical protein